MTVHKYTVDGKRKAETTSKKMKKKTQGEREVQSNAHRDDNDIDEMKK